MIDQSLQPSEFTLNTSEIWVTLSSNQKDIPFKMAYDYRFELEGSLSNNPEITPEVPYYWQNWRYFRDKKAQYETNDIVHNPFLIDWYPFHRIVDQKNQLSPDEKVDLVIGSQLTVANDPQYLCPFPEGDFDRETLKKEAENFYKSLEEYEKVPFKGIFSYRRYESPLQWLHTGYDIYHLTQPQGLVFDDKDDFFLLNLAWYLILLDPKHFNTDYLTKFCIKNGKNIDWLLMAIPMLKIKYRANFDLIDFESKLNLIPKIEMKEKTEIKKDIMEGKKGRPKRTYLIDNPINREDDANATDFTLVETGILFRYLKEAKFIINDEKLQSNADLAKLISCQTGFSDNSLKRELGKKDYSEDALKKIRTELQKIINLISRKLPPTDPHKN